MFRGIVTGSVLAIPLLLMSLMAQADVIDGEELLDPTRPLRNAATGSEPDRGVADMLRNIVPASYEVSFVRASNSSPIAVVNDQRVTIGDRVGAATVVAIDRNGVTLSVNDQERRINLFGSAVKSPVTPPRNQQ